jgi:TRAP-type C4-dicarboxylate transport system permease small subunit
MRLELLDDFFQRKGKRNALRVVCVLQELGMLIFSGIIAYYSIFMVYTQVVSKQLTTTSGTPAWILTLGFMIGMCLCTLFSLEKLSILILDKPQNGALLNEGKGK